MVGPYARLSFDKSGSGENVAGQVRRIREHCLRQGWPVRSEAFVDNHRSATDLSIERTGWEAALNALRTGEVDCLMATYQDRLFRVEEDKTILNAVLRDEVKHPVRIETLNDGELNFFDSGGRAALGFKTVMSTWETERKDGRAADGILEAARRGEPWGHNKRPFGYRPGMFRNAKHGDRVGFVTIDEEEAKLIHEAVDRFLAGDTLAGICRDWNDRGLKTTTGIPWTRTTVRQLLRGPYISGRRLYNDEFFPGIWPAIIDPAVSDELRRLIGDPGRRRAPALAPTRHLLTGFVKCNRCKFSMPVRYHNRYYGGEKVKSVRRYQCHSKGEGNHCGATGIAADRLDEFVKDAVLYMLTANNWALHRERRGVRTAGELELRGAIERDDLELARLQGAYTGGVLTLDDVLPMMEAVRTRLNANRGLLAVAVSGDPAAEHVGRGVEYGERWDAEEIEWQRDVVASMVSQVVIFPATGSKWFDDKRVDIRFRL